MLCLRAAGAALDARPYRRLIMTRLNPSRSVYRNGVLVADVLVFASVSLGGAPS